MPWNATGEAAAATVDADGRLTWGLHAYPDGLIAMLQDCADAVILLDIPIHGLDKLQSSHFRPVDKALQSVGIPLRPSTGAQRLGLELKCRIATEAGVPPRGIREIYPYAVYKWLAYVRARDALPLLAHPHAKPLLREDFPRFFPLPYKRNSRRGTRREGMEALHSLLTDADLGLRFETPLPAPDSGVYSLKRLSDVYDAVLGAVLGLHLLRNNEWAVVRGDQECGDMALLADTWLAARIDGFLRTHRNGESQCHP